MLQKIQQYKNELTLELTNILNYWMQYSVDELNGGFYGKINNNNEADINAPKGSVLNARILWTFSAAYNQTKNETYLTTAKRAFHYLIDHFKDNEFGRRVLVC